MYKEDAVEAPLTAFTLIALLENRNYVNSKDEGSLNVDKEAFNHAIDSAVRHLETQFRSDELKEPYTLALTYYALVLADSDMKDSIRAALEELSVGGETNKHWEQQSTAADSRRYYYGPPSVDVETSAYVILAYLHQDDLVSVIPLVQWLTRQRNSAGGFSSTQDTVLGLEALSKFAERSFGNAFMNIGVKAGEDSHKFSINPTNAIQFQSWKVPTIVDKVSVHASGTGIALLQVSWQFNEVQQQTQPSFDISAEVASQWNNGFHLSVCTRYLQTGKSGMTIVEIQLPSGHTASLTDLKELELQKDLQRVETKEQDTIVVIYYNSIDSSEDSQCVLIRGDRVFEVEQFKPVPVRVYSYYQTDEEAMTEYHLDEYDQLNNNPNELP